jgi:lambda family phage tail tape measure protein
MYESFDLPVKQYNKMMGDVIANHHKVKESTKKTKDAFQGLRDLFTDEALTNMLSDTMVSAYTSLEDAFITMTQNGEIAWKSMVDNMLADLTRLMIRMAIADAMKGNLAGAGAGLAGAGGLTLLSKLGSDMFRHGGSFSVNEKALPHFAHGGDFQVGGRGGPDTKLVQFMASPGENVKITNPGQSRLDNAQPQAPAPNINVVNVVDPSQMAAALSSPSGRRTILNVIQQEGLTIKRFLR